MLRKSSIDRITALLSLPTTGQEQDWDVELADESRVGEFLKVYERVHLSDNDKQVFMALILASVDRYIEAESKPPEEWQKIQRLLIKEHDLHRDTVSYWKCNEANEPQEWFHLTPHIRGLDSSR